MALVLRYATLAQLGDRFRELYRKSRGRQTYRLAKWMVDRIDDGTVTVAQIRSFFNLNQTEWNALKAEWDQLKAIYETMESKTGNGN
jgi:hypothetical protein